ncbi:hypothetical protein CDD81_5832 [Ophiocordyceps australis]|uniref:Zn(2)-C6 fungal-type domain-containing protein n=1 Tax=Ophiocordyceps australis TaxID=1399860 RepID=A0A2C5Y744_9HYPO|nr:hypothetical protein CDD81_5832 [Ophiocordyceps australis]
MASMSPMDTSGLVSGPSSQGGSVSPRQTATPKNVAFELMFSNSPQYRARLPMRVQIYPHDTTDSIVTTVKNFYGLYSGPTGSKGVSFEDDLGNTLIARYENFSNNMVVYVRVIEEPPAPFATHAFHSAMTSESYFHVHGYSTHHGQNFEPDMARPTSRASRRRSPSPNTTRGRRSDSVSSVEKKTRSRSAKNRKPVANNHADGYSDSLNGYSSGDGAPSTTSGKNKEQLGNTDISVDNIVEGGRRKRAKFESSELPLFAPPQMPAATSNPSVSPARRVEHSRPTLPFVHPGQNPFTHPRPMQSPQSYPNGLVHSNMFATPASHGHRSRESIGYVSNSGLISAGGGVLPTPDPTVGSCMSEEDKDVAIQLMRLGDSSNISHGRTSASTMDDTFSGRADAASSTGATSDGASDSEVELSLARHSKLNGSSGGKSIYETTEAHFMPTTEAAQVSGDDADYEDGANSVVTDSKSAPMRKPSASKQGSNLVSSTGKSAKSAKGTKASSVKGKKLATMTAGPMSPASMTHSRKQSTASVANMSQATGDDQPDLSTKPRCQRCRKSKKGCDRQRPCGRCRDAGLTADQCISEDEGNGRKGRYGRHMGVPVHKGDGASAQDALLPAAMITSAAAAVAITAGDKSKKRKR